MARILFLSHTSRDSAFRVGSHHLSREYIRQGHEVAHVSTPFSLVHRVFKTKQESRRRAADAGVINVEGLLDYIPRPLLPANIIWSRSQSMRVLRKINMAKPDVVFIDQPLFRADHFPDSIVIFRPTDLFATKAMRDRAREAAEASNGIAATSPGVLESFRSVATGPRAIIENGVEYARFAAAKQVREKSYDLVYVGALDSRFDFEALRRAANKLRHKSFAIFGPVPEPFLVSLPENVRFHGTVEYGQVPDTIARARLGIMPFTSSPLNAARSPMKLYEYVAAGVAVVAPSVILDRAPGLAGVAPYDASDPDDFGRAVSQALDEGLEIGSLDIQAAAEQDWAAVARKLYEFALSTRPV